MPSPFGRLVSPVQSHRATALRYPCRLAAETAHPRYSWIDPRGVSIVLSVNSGYE